MAKPPRDRTAKRASERAARGSVRDREKLWALEPGGAARRPIAVSTSALVEPRAQAMPCPQCRGELEVLEHAVAVVDERRLRVARMRCRTCGVRREVWFTLDQALPN